MSIEYWKNGSFQTDSYGYVGDDEAVPMEGCAIVSLSRFQQDRESLVGRNACRIGVRIEPGEDIDPILDDLDRIDVVALTFPAFNDGRSFSKARLLRERHGYKGEIRAVGDVLVDQVPFMLRCGFDALEVENAPTAKALKAGDIPSVDLYYQPAALQEVPVGTRPWARRAAASGRA